jgi:hypothetical protein
VFPSQGIVRVTKLGIISRKAKPSARSDFSKIALTATEDSEVLDLLKS